MREPSTHAELVRRHAQRKAWADAKRRADLVRRYPDVDRRAWANLDGSGHGPHSEGAKAVRRYLASVVALLGRVAAMP